jgi:hypothetical protein
MYVCMYVCELEFLRSVYVNSLNLAKIDLLQVFLEGRIKTVSGGSWPNAPRGSPNPNRSTVRIHIYIYIYIYIYLYSIKNQTGSV